MKKKQEISGEDAKILFIMCLFAAVLLLVFYNYPGHVRILDRLDCERRNLCPACPGVPSLPTPTCAPRADEVEELRAQPRSSRPHWDVYEEPIRR